MTRAIFANTRLRRATSGSAGAWIAPCILCILTAFYAYGALVHVMNMLSLTGFIWSEAPLKWQVLDIVYLVLDVTVVCGLVAGWWVSHAAFWIATVSQIALYTAFRSWVIDVPAGLRPTDDSLSYLDTLVAFHVVAALVMGVAIYLRRPAR